MSTNAVEKILLEIPTLSSTEQDAIKQALAYRTGSNGTVSENASAGINVSHSSDPVLSLKWVNDHASEFAGQYVALEGDRLIAHGSNADPVIETVRAAGVKAPFFTYIPSSDALPVVGANLGYHVH